MTTKNCAITLIATRNPKLLNFLKRSTSAAGLNESVLATPEG